MWNYLTVRGKSFSPSAATNQQNSVRDVVQVSQIQISAISEAIQQVLHKNEPFRSWTYNSSIRLEFRQNLD